MRERKYTCNVCGLEAVRPCAGDCFKAGCRGRFTRKSGKSAVKRVVVEPVECSECGKEFQPKRKGQLACPGKCTLDRLRRRGREAAAAAYAAKATGAEREQFLLARRLGRPNVKPWAWLESVSDDTGRGTRRVVLNVLADHTEAGTWPYPDPLAGTMPPPEEMPWG